MQTRSFVSACLTVSAVTPLVSSRSLLAAEAELEPQVPDRGPLFDVMNQLGAQQARVSESIRIKVPPLAEDGASVAVAISVGLEGVQRLALLAEKNPRPLVADVSLLPGSVPFLSTRIRLSDDSDVIALAWTESGLFMARQLVEVAVGGCGKG